MGELKKVNKEEYREELSIRRRLGTQIFFGRPIISTYMYEEKLIQNRVAVKYAKEFYEWLEEVLPKVYHVKHTGAYLSLIQYISAYHQDCDVEGKLFFNDLYLETKDVDDFHSIDFDVEVAIKILKKYGYEQN